MPGRCRRRGTRPGAAEAPPGLVPRTGGPAEAGATDRRRARVSASSAWGAAAPGPLYETEGIMALRAEQFTGSPSGRASPAPTGSPTRGRLWAILGGAGRVEAL